MAFDAAGKLKAHSAAVICGQNNRGWANY